MATITGTPSKGRKARRRTAVTPPPMLSIQGSDDSSPGKKTKAIGNTYVHRLVAVLPEGLLRPYWWIYLVLIIVGICATRLSEASVPSGEKDLTPIEFLNSTIGGAAAVADHVSSNTANVTTPQPHGDTLALLYPPGLMGGYRNQVLRFLAFVVYAMKNGYREILLQSLVWTTRDKHDEWVPVPHDRLFDVELWNSILGEDLPRLVYYKRNVHTDWTIPSNAKHESPLVTAVLKNGFMTPIADFAQDVARNQVNVNPRRIDLLPNVSHCQHPAAYGGGKGAGRLWWENMELHDKAKKNKEGFPFDANAKLLKALRPKKKFRDLATQCVVDGTSRSTVKTKEQETSLPYVALHARVELEMMAHKCGREMEKNLTKIFEMVDGLVEQVDEPIKGVFIAVSRSGMEDKEKHVKTYVKLQEIVDENLETMDRIVGGSDALGEGLKRGAVSVFECGRSAVQRYYKENPTSPDYGSILESIVNFQVAVEATAFVGVRKSSYSTDIWTTRYYMGQGKSNYEYTPDGIKLIGNGGLPPPHKTC